MTNQPSALPAEVAPAGTDVSEAAFSSLLPEAMTDALVQGASAFGLTLDAPLLARFFRFAALLEQGNRRLNLTRVRPEDYVTLHFLDSLALAAIHRPAPGARILDVGTGAGMPGVPLALAFPDTRVTLLDGTRKRLLFLEEVLADMGVTNAHTLHGRAEELARNPQYKTQYDLVTARAVAPLDALAGWLLPFARPGGLVVAYKSREAQPEIENARLAIAAQSGILEQVADITLPGTDIARKLVLIRKRR